MIAAQNKPINTESMYLYPKLSVYSMAEDKLNDLLNCAVSKSQNKYHILDLKINDPDKLRETYNLKIPSNQHSVIILSMI